MLNRISLSICMAYLAGCSGIEEHSSIGYRIVPSDFVIQIPAVGEIEAKTSTPISLPANLHQPQTISWLAEENLYVNAGQIIARIDTRFSATSLQQEDLRIAQADIQYQNKERNLSVEAGDILVEGQLLVEEEVLAERFSLQDLTFLSRKEVIDNLKNQELIEARQSFNDWRDGAHQEKSSNELGLLGLEREQIATRQSRYKQVVEQAEVAAPHDGLLVLAMNHNKREKYRPGDVVFPGNTFAFIPDLSELQARVFVLETESAGLKPGQRVELELRAFPQEAIEGEVVHVGAVAQPREEGNPLKYFETVIRIVTPLQTHWRPGLQLEATIYALEKKSILAVPSQAIFRRAGDSFVLLSQSGSWTPRRVGIGARNLAKTEIVSGIDAGDVVALYLPDGLEDVFGEER